MELITTETLMKIADKLFPDAQHILIEGEALHKVYSRWPYVDEVFETSIRKCIYTNGFQVVAGPKNFPMKMVIDHRNIDGIEPLLKEVV